MISIIINTFEREEMLIDLLLDIDKIQGHDIWVMVLVDGCDYKLEHPVFYALNGMVWKLPHYGKQKYYELMKRGWKACPSSDYYINLPDDIRLKPDFLTKAIAAFKSKDCFILDLMNDNRDKRVIKSFELVSLVNCQDLCIMYKDEALNWLKRLPFTKPSEARAKISSGVAKTINVMASFEGKPLHLINEKIVSHGDHESKMNPDRPKIIC